MNGNTQGARIRAFFENAGDDVAVIAPFIKVDALWSLLKVIPTDLHLRCVSRWLPRDIAAGVSDPEILDMLEARGNFSLSLADRLHAVLYIAGDRCLAGSANVTLAGFGEGGDGGNIEVLVETTIDDPGIAATLEAIAQAERAATRSMAQTARRLADSFRLDDKGSSMKRSVTIEYRDDVLLALGLTPEEFSEEARMLVAVKLYEMGRLSTGAAAELADIPKPLFLMKLADYGVDTFDLSAEELRRDLSAARRHCP